uniref:Uncharacterized protein n=1 Tax=Setaria viridis TaxID=4556 RepID=A0A4U6WA05_SETVI|nr:hypothetical protein SEVIR_1G186301v2 [Setaria viridis]
MGHRHGAARPGPPVPWEPEAAHLTAGDRPRGRRLRPPKSACAAGPVPRPKSAWQTAVEADERGAGDSAPLPSSPTTHCGLRPVLSTSQLARWRVDLAISAAAASTSSVWLASSPGSVGDGAGASLPPEFHFVAGAGMRVRGSGRARFCVAPAPPRPFATLTPLHIHSRAFSVRAQPLSLPPLLRFVLVQLGGEW